MMFISKETGELSWRAVTATSLAAAVLIAALAWVVVGRDSNSDTVAPKPTPAPTTTGEAPKNAYESACGLKGGSTANPPEKPTDTTWETIEGWPIPISASAGPGKRTKDGPWTCFARTPTGAAFAFYTIITRLQLAEDYNAVVTSQVAAGPGQDAVLADGQSGPAPVYEPKGFIIESYNLDDAVISIYVVQEGRAFTCSGEVAWRAGDWRLRAAADGSTALGCDESEPPSYVPWGDR